MKSRPRQFNYICIFLISVALSFPIQIMMLYGHSPLEVGAILGKIAPLNWVVLVAAAGTAYLSLRASRLLLVLIPLLMGAVAYNNWLVASVGLNYSLTTATIASVAFMAIMGLFATRETLKVILNPQMRWWMTSQRWKVEIPVRLKLFVKSSKELQVSTFDVSESGAFLPVSDERLQSDLPVGSQCYVSLPLPGMFYVQCRAEIVRVSNGAGKYPSGIGIKFLGMTYTDRKRLTSFLKVAENNEDQAKLARSA